MENGYGNLADKLSGLAVNGSNNNNDNNLFQVMKAVEAAEATIKQQVGHLSIVYTITLLVSLLFFSLNTILFYYSLLLLYYFRLI